MGFTLWMVLLYLLLLMITVLSFVRNAKIIGIITITMMALGIAVLCYLWITNPM